MSQRTASVFWVLLTFVVGEVGALQVANAEGPPPTVRRIPRVRSVMIPKSKPARVRTPASVRSTPVRSVQPARAQSHTGVIRVRRIPRVRSVLVPGSKPKVHVRAAQPVALPPKVEVVKPNVPKPAMQPAVKPSTTYPIDILAKIDAARAKLADPKVQPAPGTNMLSLVHLKTGQEALIIVDKRGRSMTNGFVTTVVKQNGINTTYSVNGGWAVVGLKTRKHSSTGYWVYVPYSPELDVPEVRTRGRKHLEETASKALAYLKGVQVRYRMKWADEFMTRTIVCLALVEHIDPGEFMRSGSIEKLIGKVMTVIGANLGNAYPHPSPVGAAGLMQIMPSTYAEIASRYKAAKLPDAKTGSSDHTTAMVVAILLNDVNLLTLGANVKLLPQQDDLGICQWLAAAYNCGAGRARGTLRSFRSEWAKKLRFKEARIYVQKLTAVWEFLYPKPKL